MPAEITDILGKYIASTRFVLLLGALTFGFSKVSGISKSIEYETIHEGGVNDHVYALPKPTTEVQRLQLERGYRVLHIPNPFTADVGLWSDQGGALAILKPDKKIHKILGFDSAYISKWEMSDLMADQSAMLCEKIELIHHGFKNLGVAELALAAAEVTARMALGDVKL